MLQPLKPLLPKASCSWSSLLAPAPFVCDKQLEWYKPLAKPCGEQHHLSFELLTDRKWALSCFLYCNAVSAAARSRNPDSHRVFDKCCYRGKIYKEDVQQQQKNKNKTVTHKRFYTTLWKFKHGGEKEHTSYRFLCKEFSTLITQTYILLLHIFTVVQVAVTLWQAPVTV